MSARLAHGLFTCCMAAAVFCAPASASLVTVLNGNLVPIAEENLFTSGPVIVAPGITWSSTNATNQGGSVYGYTLGYGFDSNGVWNGLPPMIGLNDSSDVYNVVDSMTFEFDTAVAGVGGVLNWVPNIAAVTISVFDSNMTLLESAIVSIGGNNVLTPDSFYGFLRATADIKYFTLTDGYIGLRNLEIQTSAVPLPAALPLLVTALGGLWVAKRRRRRATA